MTATATHLSEQRQQLRDLYRKALLNSTVRLEDLDVVVAREFHSRSQAREWHTADVADDSKRWESKTITSLARWGALAVPIVCLVVGLYLIGSAAFPIAVAYWQNPEAGTELVSVIPGDKLLDTTPIVITQVVTQASDSGTKVASPKILDLDLDYTNLSNWFPGTGALPMVEQHGQQEEIEYYLEIPKLNITKANVANGGTDLNKSLIAFPGTALPGQYGAPVIFGHSVLRQFYNPSEKNPRRYTTIFSTIMTLKKGDEIFVTHDGIRYTYVVQEKTEVKPSDVYILNQKYDAKRLKLVTCTPEGTYLRRGVVTAELVKEESL